MVVDMGYWGKVLRRLLVVVATVIGIYLAFKLAVFYMPFLIAFIISLLIEPIIRFVMRKTKLSRKVSAIIVLIIVFSLIIGLLVWGIASLITESANLLQGLNGYIEKISTQVTGYINDFDFSRIKISDEVMNIIKNSTANFLATLSTWISNALTGLLNIITSIPTIAIYLVISLLSIYFVCTDRLYILDQIEHHFPERWVKKIGIHVRELIKSLGDYLKAQVILILIAFVIVLIGLFIMDFMGLNIEYPLLAALAIGFVDALPILGSGTVMVPWSVISALNGDITLAAGLLILYAIILVVRQLLEPRIVSSQIGIHPIFTLIAMYTGFKFIGILGLIIGPIILIILKNVFGALIDKGVAKTIFDRK